MTLSITNPRAKAAIAAALLFALGAIAGAAADRWWSARALSGREASPLTTAAMADALDLDTAQQARVRALLSDLEASRSSRLSRTPSGPRCPPPLGGGAATGPPRALSRLDERSSRPNDGPHV